MASKNSFETIINLIFDFLGFSPLTTNVKEKFKLFVKFLFPTIINVVVKLLLFLIFIFCSNWNKK